jgi:hypothetical protein
MTDDTKIQNPMDELARDAMPSPELERMTLRRGRRHRVLNVGATAPYWITIEDGTIVAIAEQYQP